MSVRTGKIRLPLIPENLEGRIEIIESVHSISDLGNPSEVYNVGGSCWLNVRTGKMAVVKVKET